MERPDPLETSEAAGSREAAVALAYHAGSGAPRVVAKGRGLVAEAIMREAKAHGIYVHESPELVALLMQVDLDQHIPPQLYRAVAELLAWLYRMEGRMETGTEISALPRPRQTAGLLPLPSPLPSFRQQDSGG